MSTPQAPNAPAPGPAPGQWEWDTYASPIPVRPAHLGHALASEWTKIRTVRSTMWTLIVMFVLVIGIGALAAFTMAASDGMFSPLLSGGLFGLMLGQICVVTLGVLVVTSEYGTGMIRTTITACPSRVRVLTAKAIVFFGLSFTMTLLATSITAAIQSAVLGGRPPAEFVELPAGNVVDGEVVASGGAWLDATVGASLYVALLGLLALAVGALLRHSAGAITAMLGIILLPLLLALFMSAASLEQVQDALITYSPLNGLAGLFGLPLVDEGGNGWNLLWVLAAVTLATLAAAFATAERRDV